MTRIRRLTKTASNRISRNPYNALGAILVMFLTFFVGGIFVLVTLASSVIIHFYETQPNISAFLKDDTTPSQIDDIRAELEKIPSVTKIRYISKEEALEIFKERNKNEPAVTEFVTADILPSSVEVEGNRIQDFEKIANTLREEPQVASVVYLQEFVDKLIKVTSTVRIVGIGLLVFLLITSVTVTLVVIGLNISLHREEIEIMKLVGASKSYIRFPFIIEGVTYGFASAILAVSALAVALPSIAPWIDAAFNPIKLNAADPLIFIYLLAVEMFVGFLIGSIGAWIATKRYLEI